MRAGIECEISTAKRLPITLGGLRTLSFGLGTFANASSRYLMAQNPSTSLYEMTGPFGANVLATRNISGNTYGQFESQKATENTYSDALRAAISDWSNTGITVIDDGITFPGSSISPDKILETSATSYHRIYQNINFDGSSQYYFGLFIKPIDRTCFFLQLPVAAFAGSSQSYFDLSVPEPYTSGGGCTDKGILTLADGWYYCYISAISDAAILETVFLYTLEARGGTFSYAGDVTKGFGIGGINIVKADHLTSYIKAIASPVTKAKDVFYWANATLPAWLKGSTNNAFSFNFIPNYSSVQHAAQGTDTFLFSIDGTENVECYIAGADQKLYIDVDSVNKFTSASAFAWDMHDTLKVTIIPNNGSNCRVITSGFNSGNADETGTIISMQDDGDFYWAMRHTTNDLQLDGLQSEPRAGMV